MARSPDLSVWSYAQLWLGRGTDGLLPEVRESAGVWPSDAPFDADPVRTVAKAIRDKLVRSEKELAKSKPEFVADYRNECLPRLAHIWEHIPEKERLWVDFEGDGSYEMVVAADSLWPNTFWFHAFRFVAVIARDTDTRNWRLISFDRLGDGERITDTLVRDLDRDGLPEVVVRSQGLGMNSGTGFARVYSKSNLDKPVKTTSGELSFEVLVLERSPEAPVVLVTSDYYLRHSGCTVVEMAGVLGLKKQLHVWRKGRLRKIGEAYVPLFWASPSGK